MTRTIDTIVTRGDEDSLVAVTYQAEAGKVAIENAERERRYFELTPDEEDRLAAWLEERQAEIDAGAEEEDPEDDFNGEY